MPRSLPALERPGFRRYLFGAFVSNVGNMLQGAAIALNVYALTQSSFMVGLLGLIRVAPMLVFSLIGGIVADHQDRRKIILVTQMAMAVIALAFALLSWRGMLSVWLIYALVAVFSVARAFDGPARQSMVVNLVPKEVLPNAIGLNGISWRLSDVLGPLTAGLILHYGGLRFLGGYGTCYALNFISFLAVLVAIYMLPPLLPQGQDSNRPQNVPELLASIKAGLQFVNRTPVLRSAMWIDFWATFFSSADALLPAFATKLLKVGDAGYGIMQGSIGVGALLGAILMTLMPTTKRPGFWVIAMVGLYGLFTVLFGASTSLLMAVIFLAGTGFADMVSTVLRQTIRQLATPDHMRGRMSATSTLFNMTGPQLGDFEAGAFAAFTGERWSVAIGGLACLLVSAHWSRAPQLKSHEYAQEDP